MKKIFAWAAAVCLALGMCSCGEVTSEGRDDTVTASSESSQERESSDNPDESKEQKDGISQAEDSSSESLDDSSQAEAELDEKSEELIVNALRAAKDDDIEAYKKATNLSGLFDAMLQDADQKPTDEQFEQTVQEYFGQTQKALDGKNFDGRITVEKVVVQGGGKAVLFSAADVEFMAVLIEDNDRRAALITTVEDSPMTSYVKKSRLASANVNAKSYYNAVLMLIMDCEDEGEKLSDGEYEFKTEDLKTYDDPKTDGQKLENALAENAYEPKNGEYVFIKISDGKAAVMFKSIADDGEETIGRYPEPIKADNAQDVRWGEFD